MSPAGTVLHNSKNEWGWLKSKKVEGLSPRSLHHRSGFPYTKENGLLFGGLTFCDLFLLDGTGQVSLSFSLFPSPVTLLEGRGSMSQKN